jgi:hypothetical protein
MKTFLAPKQVLNPFGNINAIYSFVQYNNSIISTIGLITPTGDTDGIREYISDFSLSIGTNRHKSNMAT